MAQFQLIKLVFQRTRKKAFMRYVPSGGKEALDILYTGTQQGQARGAASVVFKECKVKLVVLPASADS
jgi:hypothetical protein